MTLWHIAQLYAVIVVLCLFILAAAVRYACEDPLADIVRRFDDIDRRRRIQAAQAASDAYVQAELLSLELDYLYSLPPREHP